MGFLYVALGGALGAAGRYAVSLIPLKSTFPFLTLLTNLVGAVLIGLIAGLFTGRETAGQNTLLFWKTGVCGGFTTFSTFSLETLGLLEKGSWFLGILYAVLSVIACVIGVLVGKKLALLIHP